MLSQIKWQCFFLAFLLPILGWAHEGQPWVGNYLEFEWESRFQFQAFRSLACGSNLHSYPSQDLFLQTQLSLSATPQYSVTLGAMAARTRRQKGGIDHLFFNSRYVFLDDVLGDPVTLTIGLNLIHAFSWSLHDPGSFHHGKNEGKLCVSIGKEWAIQDQWVSRLWSMIGIGSAVKGSPWIDWKMAYAQKIHHNHEVEFFLQTLWGLGSKNIHPYHFQGYQSIHHQSVDLGMKYSYLIEFMGMASIEYTKRLYTKNFPYQTDRIQFSFDYPFGL